MYYHVHDGVNAWSKFNDHRCYNYCANAKQPPNNFIMYYMKLLVTVSWKLNNVQKIQHVTACPVMEPDLCAKFHICAIYGF